MFIEKTGRFDINISHDLSCRDSLKQVIVLSSVNGRFAADCEKSEIAITGGMQ